MNKSKRHFFDIKNIGKQVDTIYKLNEGQIYIIEITTGNMIRGIIVPTIDTKNISKSYTCGILINKKISNQYSNNVDFHVGYIYDDNKNIKEHIYNLFLACDLTSIKSITRIYEYYLTFDLQRQIKWSMYYKKTINNLCKELQINEDIEKMIFKFLN